MDFFDSIAPEWDRHEKNSTPARISSILNLIRIPAGGNILDLGTGTGVLIPALCSEIGSGGSVTAVDFSREMLKIARRKCYGLPNVSFLNLNFEAEAIDGRFDLITLYCVYPHLRTPLITLRRLIDNNLRKNGRLVIAFPTDEKFINEVHGRKKIESEPLPSAYILAESLCLAGFNARCLSYSPTSYIVEIAA